MPDDQSDSAGPLPEPIQPSAAAPRPTDPGLLPPTVGRTPPPLFPPQVVDAKHGRIGNLVARVAIVAVVLIVAGVFVATRDLKHQVVDNADAPTAPTFSQDPGGPSSMDPQYVLEHPFTDSPAEDWASGAGGILPPTAVGVGDHSAAQVAAVEAQLKQLLVGAHLDNTMLEDHDSSVYLGLLAPAAAERDQAALTGGQAPDFGGQVTLLNEDVLLFPTPVRVHGSMSVSIGAQDNLLLHTDYSFAFAFQPDDMSQITSSTHLVGIERVQADYLVVQDSRQPAAEQGFSPLNVTKSATDLACSRFAAGYVTAVTSQVPGSPGAGC
jgi:hypothetical protein